MCISMTKHQEYFWFLKIFFEGLCTVGCIYGIVYIFHGFRSFFLIGWELFSTSQMSFLSTCWYYFGIFFHICLVFSTDWLAPRHLIYSVPILFLGHVDPFCEMIKRKHESRNAWKDLRVGGKKMVGLQSN